MAEETDIDIKPDELVALAVIHDLVTNNPDVVAAVLAQHNEQPSTDPEENILKLSKLSAKMGRWFNEDFDKAAASAGFHGAEFVPHILAGYVGRQKDIKNFQAGYWSLKDLFGKKEGGTKVGNAIRDLFNKPKPGTTAPAVTPAQMAESPAADVLKKEIKTGDDDKKEIKKILGMAPALFWSLTAGVVLLIIVIIIMIIRAGKKKKAAEAK